MPERRVFNVGVIGLGFGGKVFAPMLEGHPRCRLVAVASTDAGRAEAAAAEFGAERGYGDWRRLVADPGVDVVMIAVPPTRQGDMIEAAVEAGKHVFAEKPLGVPPERLQPILDVAAARGLAHTVDFEFRAVPQWIKTRDLLREKRLGSIRHVLIHWTLETYAHAHGLNDSWKTNAEQGGGALNLFGSHTLFYIEWLFGRIEALASTAFTTQAVSSGENLVQLLCRLTDGTPVTCVISDNSYRGRGHVLEVYGETGTLRLSNPGSDYMKGFALTFADRAAGSDFEPVEVEDPLSRFDGDGRIYCVKTMMDELLDAAERGEPAAVNLAHGGRVDALLSAVRASWESGRWVEAPDGC